MYEFAVFNEYLSGLHECNLMIYSFLIYYRTKIHKINAAGVMCD